MYLPEDRHVRRKILAASRKPKWSEKKDMPLAKDLCRLMIATNIPWHAVENPEFRTFVNKWIKNATPPSRNVLATKVLSAVVKDVEGPELSYLKGKLGSGQCDGWKNVAKTSLVASIITVEGKVSLILLVNEL